jgi:tRNA1(Val) A37 N6-methylase TrmN6
MYTSNTMSEVRKQESNAQDFAEKFVYGRYAWFLLTEMWQQGRVIVPGRESIRQLLSNVAERRQTTVPVNPTAAQRLLANHATSGALSTTFTDPSGGIEIPLEIDPNVFNPNLTKASRLLLSVARLAGRGDSRVLDAFTGSGVLGMHFASIGADVVAYDTSEAAVACARKNAFNNQLADKLSVRQGDHTCLHEGELFDLIVANPPLLPCTPPEDQPLASAVFDPGLSATESFIEALPSHLAPAGLCYVITSSTFDRPGRDMYTECEKNNLTSQLVMAAPREHEWYRIHEIQLARME